MELYDGKCVFLTGATGFLGKVVIEKFLRCAPEIGQIFALIRPNDTETAQERLENELLTSDIFERLRQERSNFEQFAASKLVAVAGDITQPLLGLNEIDAELVCSRVQITIHSAATVRFDQLLSVAVRINCVGSMNMLEFVKSCRRVLAHVHVSTAYVNSDRSELEIREELYPLAVDVDEVMQLAPSEIDGQRATIMGRYANTYTVSKSMGEHLMVKHCGGIPLVIYRPTFIGASLKEPVPGWVDNPAGFGGIILGTGLGLLTILPGDRSNVLDIVPVDLAANYLVLSICAKLLDQNVPQPLIVHCGTSDPHQNNFSLGVSEDLLPKYFVVNPMKKAVAPAQLKYYPSYQEFETQRMLRYVFPVAAYWALAKETGCDDHEQTAKQLSTLAQRAGRFMDTFALVTMNQWRFLAGNSKLLQPYTTSDWWIDTYQIDWEQYVVNYCASIATWSTQQATVDASAQPAKGQIRARL